ncbi:MAG: DUF2203 family protein [Bdellovibrionaceae bacterium]|nr:DUF2203 family protein [Pseudobdellovibrionaceae bacterium]
MSDGQLVDITRRGVLSFDEAYERVLILKRLTGRYVDSVERRMTQLESLLQNQMELIHIIENEINILIHEWHRKVRNLGGIPKGLWLVDFDAGFGQYCWKHPEPELAYWHTYNEGFESRKKITFENEIEIDHTNVIIVSHNL